MLPVRLATCTPTCTVIFAPGFPVLTVYVPVSGDLVSAAPTITAPSTYNEFQEPTPNPQIFVTDDFDVAVKVTLLPGCMKAGGDVQVTVPVQLPLHLGLVVAQDCEPVAEPSLIFIVLPVQPA